MQQKIAFIDGFAKCLEDNGVDPGTFFKQAQNSSDSSVAEVGREAVKVANYALNEKRRKTASKIIKNFPGGLDSSWVKQLFKNMDEGIPNARHFAEKQLQRQGPDAIKRGQPPHRSGPDIEVFRAADNVDPSDVRQGPNDPGEFVGSQRFSRFNKTDDAAKALEEHRKLQGNLANIKTNLT